MEADRNISPPRSAGLLFVAAIWALLLTLVGSPEVVFFTVPVFLLAAPLAFGRYTGEGLIGALRGGRVRTDGRDLPRHLIDAARRAVTPVHFERRLGRAPPVSVN
ncbi:MAG TPA: hypothetical protein PKA56_09430 [Solirubrobacterales bacterium]|nr:hypothetical protein [Solirubrobacterales bacterium]HMU27784.1 hypothetical protein [Solirubrobacterales bacterium]HMX71965.1 hypothetical protein [Solirubrobacterales bacterium]HMY26794.1 hypothetical protein [Solirubrobacterales bacterium]HNA45314.1 hypothetical protein [Solirubrobacterales bacterium]